MANHVFYAIGLKNSTATIGRPLSNILPAVTFCKLPFSSGIYIINKFLCGDVIQCCRIYIKIICGLYSVLRGKNKVMKQGNEDH